MNRIWDNEGEEGSICVRARSWAHSQQGPDRKGSMNE